MAFGVASLPRNKETHLLLVQRIRRPVFLTLFTTPLLHSRRVNEGSKDKTQMPEIPNAHGTKFRIRLIRNVAVRAAIQRAANQEIFDF